VSRRRLLGFGGLLFGFGFAAQALATSFVTFAIPNIVARIGGSPQHPVGNGLLAEQFPEERRGFAISAHIAGGNMGTVVIAVIGVPMLAWFGWRGSSIVFGVAAALIGVLILALVREHGTDRAAAVAGGSSRDALRRVIGDPSHGNSARALGRRIHHAPSARSMQTDPAQGVLAGMPVGPTS
jgi:MFS family permease